MDYFKDIEFILQHSIVIFTFFFFILGCMFGSFFNVIILRYPLMIDNNNANDIKEWLEEKKITVPIELQGENKKLDLAFPASHCFSCKTPLKWYHNIPLFSYIFLKGKCGFCKADISIQYPLVEFLSGIILAFTYFYFIPQGLIYFAVAAFLFLTCFILAAIDLKVFLLPDVLTYSILWLGLLLTTQNISLFHITTLDSIYGILTGYLSLYIIALIGKIATGKDAMGNGDFKLLAALGAYIGFKGALFGVFFSPFIGLLTWILMKIFKKDTSLIPYGPSLIIGSMTYIFYGKEILKIFNIYI